jgi:uncharacterized membrane protein
MEDFSPSEAIEPLSSKNLTILEEQLSQETLIILKLKQYSKQCQDSELKNLCSQLAEKHKNNYNTLLNYVVSHISSG